MATLVQIRNAVDAKLATLWSAIQTKEDAYAAAHNGRYWQGLVSHQTTPSEGNTSLPDIGSACPSDQQGQPWPNAVLTTPLEMALRIDCYDGPLGSGYAATVYVSVLGNLYSRTQQAGPEVWRTAPWALVGVP